MGGGGGGDTTSTVYQSSLPQYAKPYYESLMQRGQAESTRPYQPYAGPRIAGQSGDTTRGLNMASGYAGSSLQGVQNAIGQTGGLAAMAANMANYTPDKVSNTYKGPVGGPISANDIVSSYNPANYTAQGINNTYTGPLGGGYTAGQFNAGNVGFEGGVPTGVNQLSVGEFDQAAADKYMSPYMQSVVDKARKDNSQATLEEQTYRNASAAKSGAFGGSRAAVQNQMALNAMQDRNVDISVQGHQSAFENAQQQFERDRGASLTAQQGNQQTALSMLQGNQQAGLEAQKAREQSRQFGFSETESARQAAAQMGLDAQKASEQFRQSGFTANQEAQQAANMQRLEAQKASEQFKQSAFGANQDAYQSAAGLNLDAMKANQQAGLAGRELGLAGIGQAMQGTEQMTQMQQSWDNMMLDRIKAQLGVGQTKEDYSQERMDLAYDDFINQRDSQRQNLQFMSSLLQGVPVSANQNVVNNQSTNPVSGAAGSLMGLQALYQLGKQ